MSRPLVKICGVRSPETAAEAILAGADFIGLVFHKNSKRCVYLDNAKLISATTRKMGAIAVGVFVEQSALEIQSICELADLDVIQLQGKLPRQEHHLLSKKYTRFYVQSVSPDGTLLPDEEEGLIHLNPARDYLLFDNQEAGIGKTFDWNQFEYTGNFRLALAGGLNPKNVAIAIKKFRPDIIDVSSGVENASGEKDSGLIKQFIAAREKNEK